MSDNNYIEVPILRSFDKNEPIGTVRILKSALPDDPNFVLALGFQADKKKCPPPGEIPTTPYRGPWTLQCVALVDNTRYFQYLVQTGHRQ